MIPRLHSQNRGTGGDEAAIFAGDLSGCTSAFVKTRLKLAVLDLTFGSSEATRDYQYHHRLMYGMMKFNPGHRRREFQPPKPKEECIPAATVQFSRDG